MRPSDADIIADARAMARELGAPRCLFIDQALALITDPRLGYSIENGATRDAYVAALYLDLIVPRIDGAYDISEQKLKQAYAAASAQSSCGITTEAIWRYAGVDDPRLFMWYPDRAAKGGSYYAVSLEVDIAKDHGAWRSGIPWVEGTPLPEPGDAPIIGLMQDPSFTRGGGFAGEHEFTVVSWLGGLCHSVDGGQPHIDLRTRGVVEVWTGTNADGARTGELWFGQVDKETGEMAIGHDGRPVSGRRAIGYTDVSALPLSGSASCLEETGAISSLRRAPWKQIGAGVLVGGAVLALAYYLVGRKK